MPVLRRFIGALRALFHRQRAEQDLDDELRAYLDAAVEEKMSRGLSRVAAERAARVEIGSLAAVKDDTRDAGWESALHSVARDVRRALRSLRRAPWYAATVICVLALGLAMVTVTFAVADGVLFKPLPFDRPDELFLIHADATSAPSETMSPVSRRDIEAWQAAMPGSAIAAIFLHPHPFDAADSRERVSAAIDERLFDVLRVQPIIGGFTPEDYDGQWLDETVSLQPTLIGFRDWQRDFGGAPNVVGRVVIRDVNGDRQRGIRVSGVLPRGFVLPVDGREVAELSPVSRTFPQLGRRFSAVVRLPTSQVASFEQAANVATQRLVIGPAPHQERIGQQPPLVPYDRVRLVRVGDYLTARERPVLSLVFAGTIGLLFLACLNVAALMAARNEDRRYDVAICRALGASRAAMARAVLVEAALLGSAAVAVALVLSQPLLVWTVELLPATMVVLKEPALDARVFGAIAIFGVLCVMAAGLWPAAASARRDAVAPALLASERSTGRSRRPYAAVVAIQVAIGFVLVTAGGLTLASVAAAYRNDTGYARQRAILLQTHVVRQTPASSSVDILRAIPARIGLVPGVRDVAMSTVNPLLAERANAWTSVGPEGWQDDVEGVVSRHVSVNFFELLGLRLVDGRWPQSGEWVADQPVAIISQTAARRFWPEGSAVGRTLVSRLRRPATYRIIGVVSDARFEGLDARPLSDIYLPDPLEQSSGRTGVFFHVSTTRAASEVLPAVLAAISDPALRMAYAATHEDALFASIKHRVLPAWLFGTFGMSALAMLGAGTLGLLAMAVARRTREIGIRMALGASPRRMAAQLVREQLTPVMLGLGFGAVICVWVMRFAETMLYGVSVYDPIVWTSVAVVLLVVATVGALAPALRAARIDPARVLKSD